MAINRLLGTLAGSPTKFILINKFCSLWNEWNGNGFHLERRIGNKN